MKNKKLVIGNVVLFYIVGFLSMILVDQGNRMDLSDSKSNLFTAILRLFKIDLVNNDENVVNAHCYFRTSFCDFFNLISF